MELEVFVDVFLPLAMAVVWAGVRLLAVAGLALVAAGLFWIVVEEDNVQVVCAGKEVNYAE